MAHVLVVEDDQANCDVIIEVLEEAGYTALRAEDAAKAIEILRAAAEPLVIVLDYGLPGQDGAGVLRALLDDCGGEAAPRHAAVVVTAWPAQMVVPAVKGLFPDGSVPVLRKPFQIEALLREVERAASRAASRAAVHPGA